MPHTFKGRGGVGGAMEGGIDEAGRGPVFGPLVVAGVACADPEALRGLGCRDSKLLSPPRRERLARLVRDLPGVAVEVRTIEAHELDAERVRSSLNEVEAVRFQDIASCLAASGARKIVVDAADTDAARFGRRVALGLPPGVEVVSEHKADLHHACVAAASIVAKVARDAAVAQAARRLERRLGLPLGSGYASDPQTQAFLRGWHAAFGGLPEGTRLSWRTAKGLLAPQQAQLPL